MKYFRYIFILFTNKKNAINENIVKIEEESLNYYNFLEENDLNYNEEKIQNKIKTEVYDCLNNYIKEHNIKFSSIDNIKNILNIKNIKNNILIDIYEKYKNQKRQISKYANLFIKNKKQIFARTICEVNIIKKMILKNLIK